MNNKIYCCIILLFITIQSMTMEKPESQQPLNARTPRSRSHDSPLSTARSAPSSPRSVLTNPELKEQAHNFFMTVQGTTQAQEASLVAQLISYCNKGDREKAQQLHKELAEAHAWNKKKWQQITKDYQNANATFIKFLEEELNKQELSEKKISYDNQPIHSANNENCEQTTLESSPSTPRKRSLSFSFLRRSGSSHPLKN